MAKETTMTTTITALKTETLEIKLIGTTDLILFKKPRSFVREEIFKQSHPKGTKIPAEYQQPYNLFEKLITGITWENHIETFDDYSKYTEEMWKDLMQNNRPCILSKAFSESMKEAFISLGYKDSTGKTGADLRRIVKFVGTKNPISFESAEYDQHLTPNNTVAHTNVLAQYNIFHGWESKIKILYVKDVFPRETVLDLVNNAGQFIGVGTRRTEGFGNYRIGDVKIVG